MSDDDEIEILEVAGPTCGPTKKTFIFSSSILPDERRRLHIMIRDLGGKCSCCFFLDFEFYRPSPPQVLASVVFSMTRKPHTASPLTLGPTATWVWWLSWRTPPRSWSVPGTFGTLQWPRGSSMTLKRNTSLKCWKRQCNNRFATKEDCSGILDAAFFFRTSKKQNDISMKY